jgi:hypothetical protein
MTSKASISREQIRETRASFTGNGIGHKNFRELLGDFCKGMKRAFRSKASVKDSGLELEHDGNVEVHNDEDEDLEMGSEDSEDSPRDDADVYDSESSGEDNQKIRAKRRKP